MQNPYENTRWLGRHRPGGIRLTERLVRKAQLPAGSRILDVGCGEGESCAHLLRMGYRATGLDHSSVLVGRGRRRFPQCDFVVGEAASPPMQAASQDALLMECVLSATVAPRVLTGCAPLLRPGGMLLLSDLYARAESDETEKPELRSREQWGELLAAAGLKLLGFEDASHELREFCAQAIMDDMQLEQLLCTSLHRLHRARAGYCLLWAENTSDS